MTGSDIKPHDAKLLTDLDVDYAPFHCCGDEDLVFLRCPRCGHIWVECYECSTWYVDLNDLSRRANTFGADRVACPSYLRAGAVDRYLPTAAQVRTAGFERYLGPHLRQK